MTTDIAGRRGQRTISRDALQRWVTWLAIGIAGIATSGWIFTTGALAYVASLPRDVPYILRDNNGVLDPIERAITPDDADTTKLLEDWFGAWRQGCNDPLSLCFQQTQALVPSTAGDPIAKIVHDYNQSVADGHWRVTPSNMRITGSGTAWTVDWNERAENDSGAHVERVMRAIVTTGQGPEYVSLRSALVNPWGVGLKDLRIIESGSK
jgi:type IV secretory pathway TrbF-like protein